MGRIEELEAEVAKLKWRNGILSKFAMQYIELAIEDKCPTSLGLPDIECAGDIDCEYCWRQALKTIGIEY